jgi:hypothetical protein
MARLSNEPGAKLFLLAIGAVLLLAGLAGAIWTIVEAFSEDTTQGVLCLFCGVYALYFIIAKIESPKKWIILALYLYAIPGWALVQNA